MSVTLLVYWKRFWCRLTLEWCGIWIFSLIENRAPQKVWSMFQTKCNCLVFPVSVHSHDDLSFNGKVKLSGCSNVYASFSRLCYLWEDVNLIHICGHRQSNRMRLKYRSLSCNVICFGVFSIFIWKLKQCFAKCNSSQREIANPVLYLAPCTANQGIDFWMLPIF